MNVHLEITEGPAKGQTFHFTHGDVALLGRSPRCHCCVGDDIQASRVHLIMEIAPEACRIHDLGSVNGTFVNGQRVADAELRQGDILRIGQTKIDARVEAFDAFQTGQEAPPADAEDGTPVASAAPRDDGDVIFTTDEPDAEPCARCGQAPGDAHNGSGLCPRCREEMREHDEQLPGYHLIRQLSDGGMGVVWQAKDTRSGRAVAVKIPRPALAASPRAGRIFIEESRVSLTLHHPNIVEFIAAGEYQGQLYIAMEFVDGQSAEHLRRQQGGRLPARVVKTIAVQALEALQYAHGQRIVHGGLKPANLLLTGALPDCRVKMADFGLARNARDAGMSGLTHHGDVRGSLSFLPPEQIVNSRGVDHRADIFGLAATMYALLTGASVYNFDPARKDPLLTIIDDELVPIEQRGVTLPAFFAAVISRATRKNPDERFRTAEEMCGVLQSVTV